MTLVPWFAVFGILRAGGIVVGFPIFNPPLCGSVLLRTVRPPRPSWKTTLLRGVIELAGLSSFEKGLVVIDAAGDGGKPSGGARSMGRR